jgi:hypothetical protein
MGHETGAAARKISPPLQPTSSAKADLNRIRTIAPPSLDFTQASQARPSPIAAHARARRARPLLPPVSSLNCSP